MPMALKDQPYLPLYIQDLLTDEKLKECNAASHGVYFLLMCLLHKQPQYGTILLKQKYKQKESKYDNFALMLARHFPFDLLILATALEELHSEDVIQIDGDLLSQKRMVKDAKLSETRANAGRRGGKSLQTKLVTKDTFANDFAKTKKKANTEIEYEYEYENEVDNENVKKGGTGENLKDQINHLPNFQTHVFLMEWERWEDYLAEHRKYLTNTARLTGLCDLYTASGDNATKAIEIIRHSIKNNWKTLHAPDGKQNGKVAEEDTLQIIQRHMAQNNKL